MKIHAFSQFEDSEYKDVFLSSNLDLGKCAFNIQTLWDWHESLPSG